MYVPYADKVPVWTQCVTEHPEVYASGVGDVESFVAVEQGLFRKGLVLCLYLTEYDGINICELEIEVHHDGSMERMCISLNIRWENNRDMMPKMRHTDRKNTPLNDMLPRRRNMTTRDAMKKKAAMKPRRKGKQRANTTDSTSKWEGGTGIPSSMVTMPLGYGARNIFMLFIVFLENFPLANPGG